MVLELGVDLGVKLDRQWNVDQLLLADAAAAFLG